MVKLDDFYTLNSAGVKSTRITRELGPLGVGCDWVNSKRTQLRVIFDPAEFRVYRKTKDSCIANQLVDLAQIAQNWALRPRIYSIHRTRVLRPSSHAIL